MCMWAAILQKISTASLVVQRFLIDLAANVKEDIIPCTGSGLNL